MTNEVHLAGRVTRDPEERVLPSGDKVVSFRLSVPRPADSPRPGADWVDCAVWTARLRRSVARWVTGDEVEVSGALRRRVFRTGAGVVPLVEIEVSACRRSVRSEGPA
ncbi:single-stranded DNA-binding protein [Nocardioides jejuensis]|uniref:Single-stranded DNA-binding protein n=1 Tax=Nocardioides jejuensis TaxID=2502782 RepID=A0A4R1C189_9ACTN|nr:single-stranded DNA-binding protein [Nocardioides jejuensis]TCJ23445.1 single-stranded DNA-binding protein [Nocardioides jejuensis]